MHRLRSILGLVAGAMMILSGAAHSILGWKQLKVEFSPLHAPPDLVRVLGAGWHFGGVAMLAFGCIVVALFSQRLRGRSVSLVPAIVIGMTYVVYGVSAFLVGHFDPFFAVFVVPGVMLLIASPPPRAV